MSQAARFESQLPPIASSTESDNLTDEDISSFALRMNEVFKSTKTESDRLRELQKTDPEALASELEELVDEVTEQDTGYIQTLSALKKARALGGDESIYVQQLKDLRNKIEAIIRSESGLFDDSIFSQIENAKYEIASLLSLPHQDVDNENPTRDLETLGIIRKNDDGGEIYSFPYSLMPDSVNKKWTIYLAAVCKHVQAADAVMVTGDKTAVEVADRARTFAHNSVTDDVHAILGLEGKGGWNRAKTRLLLGTIRDHELPTYESASDENAHELVSTNTNEIIIASLLASRSHDS